MKNWDALDNDAEWEILAETPRSQAAIMKIASGKSEGGPNNKHIDSDQWLYVLKGSGSATVDGQSVALCTGSLLLIEAGETHQIRADDGSTLETVNFYGPPAEVD